MQAATLMLRSKGIGASFEYPGFIQVPLHFRMWQEDDRLYIVTIGHLTIGTANETIGADLHTDEGEHRSAYKSEIPSTTLDASAIADWVESLMKEHGFQPMESTPVESKGELPDA